MLDFILIRKLGPMRYSMLKRGMLRQVLLTSPDLSPTEKAILIRFVKGER